MGRITLGAHTCVPNLTKEVKSLKRTERSYEAPGNYCTLLLEGSIAAIYGRERYGMDFVSLYTEPGQTIWLLSF